MDDIGSPPLVKVYAIDKSISLCSIRKNLLTAASELSFRGLTLSAKWAAEQAAGIPQGHLVREREERNTVSDDSSSLSCNLKEDVNEEERLLITLAKSYFDLREFKRAADIAKGGISAHALALYSYSKYLSGEKRKEEEQLEQPGIIVHNRELAGIRDTLSTRDSLGLLDGVCLYIYGLVLAELGEVLGAREACVRSVEAYPWNWSAWQLLGDLCCGAHRHTTTAASVTLADTSTSDTTHSTVGVGGRTEILSLSLPPTIMCDFFYAYAFLQLQQKDLNTEALRIYLLLHNVFPSSCYLIGRTAVAHYKLNSYVDAEELFEVLNKQHPHRLEDLDIYSNILFVNGDNVQLSCLAYNAVQVDKYRPETCCIIGNYYSAMGEHEKAILYYERALKLDRHYNAARVLIGLEYIELKNPSAAEKQFRNAVEANPREWRAWYGLGQTHELLKMPLYALYYYRKATELRSKDARMWCAQAKCYKGLKRLEDAIECYKRAELCEDCEGIALKNLAELYNEAGDEEKAAYYHKKNLQEVDKNAPVSIKFLAQFHMRHENYKEAEKYANLLMECAGNPKDKEEGDALLRDINSRG